MDTELPIVPPGLPDPPEVPPVPELPPPLQQQEPVTYSGMTYHEVMIAVMEETDKRHAVADADRLRREATDEQQKGGTA